MNDELTKALQEYLPQLVRLADRNISERFQGKIDADDVAASVCRTMLRRYGASGIPIQRGEDDLWKLLVTITLNKVRNKARHFSATKRNVSRENPILNEELISAMRSPPGPQEAAELNDLLATLQRRLDETSGTILRLMLTGDSQEEIAEQLGVTSRTIRRKQQVIRAELLKLVE